MNQRTDDELNSVIAEWMGWKWTKHSGGTRLQDPSGCIVNENYAEEWRVPNYAGDLNACHEAVGKCNDSQAKQWVYALNVVIRAKLRESGVHQWPDDFRRFNASALERAEALVKVIEQQKGQG